MEIILATTNQGKAEEIRRIFKDHSILLPPDLGVDFDYEEGCDSYLSNAEGKAKALYNLVGRPVLADDSGLSVAALGGGPGVRSSRYGSDHAGSKLAPQERNRLLLSKLAGQNDRRAFFVCCMVLILSEYRFYIVQETLAGVIAESPSGSGGFGYDPVFYIPELERTVAELGSAEKDRISHRGKAARRILAILAI